MKLRGFLFVLTVFICSLESLSQDILISQGGVIETCSGTFYDSGGTQVYHANEDHTITICPEEPGQVIQLDFDLFSTQPNADILTIFNGDSDEADDFGSFSGFNVGDGPNFIAADNPTGCLTFHWISNNAAQTTGWEASISCFEPCQEISGTIENTNPQPDEEGRILLCPGDEVEFLARENFLFLMKTLLIHGILVTEILHKVKMYLIFLKNREFIQ